MQTQDLTNRPGSIATRASAPPRARFAAHAFPLPLFLLVAAALPPYLLGLGSYPIRDAESKYAEIPREMLATGDWLTLHLDYTRYLSKPPLSFWLTAVTYRVLGVSELTARLPNVLAALAVALALGGVASTLLGRRAGILAAALWLTSGEVYVYTRDAGIEMVLLAFMTFSVLGFLRGPLARDARWTAVGWLAAALGVFTKGPMAVLFPAASLALWCRFAGRRVSRADLRPGLGLALLIAVVGPWFALMVRAHDDVLWYVFVHEQLYRLLGTRLPNDALYPTGLFLAQVAGEFFPWVFALPYAFARAAAALRPGAAGASPVYAESGGLRITRREVPLLALLWAAVPLVVFSLARSKVDFYGLHAYPGLLLLVTWLLEEALRARGLAVADLAAPAADARVPAPRPSLLAAPWLFCSAGAACACVLLLLGPTSLAQSLGLPAPAVVWSFLLPALLGGLLAGWACFAGRTWLALGGVSLLAAGFFAANAQLFQRGEAGPSMRFAAVAFREEALDPEARLVSTERPEFAHVSVLTFYSGRQAYLLRNPEPSQLHFSMRDPEAVVLDEPQLVAWVDAGRPTYMVGEKAPLLPRLERLGLAAEVRATSGKSVLVRLRRR
ncbi:MAG: glycosyltransferase family 39 protein [Planctomycetes bacterium]|nr:glycosyltransferase family 39 protein [Planctomycetota bacterium]